MNLVTRVFKTWFCPKCDRPFTSLQSNIQGKKLMEDHLKLAHNEYYNTMYKG